MIGKQIGHYQIEGLLGAGGMGEVYRARDTKLGRSVAVKVLPEAFAQDSERVARFEREAKLLAALNHVNIATLYGLDQFDGKHFLAMELVDGETLAGRIRRGAIPIEEALRIAHQIADALEAAHEKGIIHRDLKPANVKITPEGKVKVLDFGLAKALENAPADANTMNSPTLSRLATNQGVVLGTAGYMAPEQAKGRNADARSDVFSFGCVLFEMVTGRQTFEGETATEVIASILKQEADLSVIPANIDRRVVDLIRRCLAKDPKKRWHAVADVRVEIETILAESRGIQVAAPLGRRSILKFAGWIAATAVLASVSTLELARRLQPQQPVSISRFSVALPEGQTLTRTGRHGLNISPDGEKIVYVANNQIYLRTMSDVEPHPIQGTSQDVSTPVFSPDGRWLAFFSVSDGVFKKVPIAGGTAVTVCGTDNPFGASWTSDDHILIGQGSKGIIRVSANGGKPETIVTAKSGEFMHNPQLLPDGDHILFTVATTAGPERWNKADIAVHSLKSGERKVLFSGGGDVRYVPTGHLIYAVGTTLQAIPIDLKKLAVMGGPVSIADGVMRAVVPEGNTGMANFAFSNNGTMVYFIGDNGTTGNRTLALVDRAGVRKALPVTPRFYWNPRISPDGKRIVIEESNTYLWIYDLAAGTAMRRLTLEGNSGDPVWTRDGQKIIFRSDRGGDQALYWQQADGNGTAERLTTPEKGASHAPLSISPDGKILLFKVSLQDGGDIWMLPLEGDHTPKRLIADPNTQNGATFSPDGRWVAYQSAESGGHNEIYVQPFPTTGAKYQVTSNGGGAPRWSPDGKQIFYIEQQQAATYGQLVSVDIRAESGFAISDPKKLPIERIAQLYGSPPYDITPDGKQFLVIYFASDATPNQVAQQQMRITLNWFEELKQRMK